MKTKWVFYLGFLLLAVFLTCSKDDNDPNSLGGDTNIALTAVNSETSVFGSYQGLNVSGGKITVKSNDKGLVTYEAVVDLNQFPDSLKLKALTIMGQVFAYYNFSDTSYSITPDNKLKFQFQLKITSEGYMDFFTEGKPWVIGKYGDGVGTKYTVTNDNGEELVREVTEKTGNDDWPFGFYLIKTSKIEHVAPADNPAFEKVTYRINHRFGLVYVEYLLRDGTVLRLNVYASFV